MAVLTGDDRFEEVLKESGKGEITKMCEVLDRVEKRGIAIGESRGIGKGKAEGRFQSICSLMKNLTCSPERAMDLLEIPAEEREGYLLRLGQISR